MRILAVIPGSEDGEGFIFARRQVEQLRELGFQVDNFWLVNRTSPRLLLSEARRFRQVVRDLNPDVVHAHYGTVTAVFCALLAKPPLVITFRGSDLNPSSEHGLWRSLSSRWMSQMASALATEVICVSEELRRRLWCKNAAAYVIPSGVDLTRFRPLERDDARTKLGWSLTERIVLFNHGASKAPNKRKDLVEAAIDIARRQLDAVRLVVLEGDVPGELVPLYLNAADVTVLTSDFEGSPNIIKESLACGVPICTVDVGDVRQMLAGVSACRIVDRTAPAIADGLVDLIAHPSRSNGPMYADRFSAAAHTPRVAEVLSRARVRFHHPDERIPAPRPHE